jgi:hypothetical protein
LHEVQKIAVDDQLTGITTPAQRIEERDELILELLVAIVESTFAYV